MSVVSACTGTWSVVSSSGSESVERSASVALWNVPDVSFAEFPWGHCQLQGAIERGAVTISRCDDLARAMLDWQRCIVASEGVECDDFAVRMLLHAKRVHCRVTVMARVLGQESMDLCDKVLAYNEAVAYLEAVRGWQGDLVSVEDKRALEVVLADRRFYDVSDKRELQQEALSAALTNVVSGAHSASSLAVALGGAADHLMVKELPHAVLIGVGESSLSDLLSNSMSGSKPVGTLGLYKFLMAGGIETVSNRYFVRASAVIGGKADKSRHLTEITTDIDHVLIDEVFYDIASVKYFYIYAFEVPKLVTVDGYCYLRCFPLADRYTAYSRLGRSPTVRSCRTLLVMHGIEEWADEEAIVAPADVRALPGVWHVLTDGNLPSQMQDSLILAGENSVVKDPFVRDALKEVFSFDSALVRKPPVLTVAERSAVKSSRFDTIEPVSRRQSPTSEDASMDELAHQFFENLGVTAERVPAKFVDFSDVNTVMGVASAEWVGMDEQVRDTERAREIEQRMQSGPVISRAYCKSVAKRHSKGKSRPRPGSIRGRALEFGSMYVPKVVTNSVVWREDDELTAPGWTTVVAKIPAGEHTLTLVSPVDSHCDCRLDWSGEHSSVTVADTVQCPCDGTVMWFVNALPVRVKGSKSSVVRCSVSMTGRAFALGWDVKRFYLIHQSVGFHIYSTVRPPTCVEVVLKCKWHGTAGVTTCMARSAIEASSVPIGVNFIVRGSPLLEQSLARDPIMPAMLGISSSNGGAISRVFIGGATFLPDKQGKVTLVTKQWQSDLSVSVLSYTVIKFSVMFITDPHAFEVHYANRKLETPTSP